MKTLNKTIKSFSIIIVAVKLLFAVTGCSLPNSAIPVNNAETVYSFNFNREYNENYIYSEPAIERLQNSIAFSFSDNHDYCQMNDFIKDFLYERGFDVSSPTGVSHYANGALHAQYFENDEKTVFLRYAFYPVAAEDREVAERTNDYVEFVIINNSDLEKNGAIASNYNGAELSDILYDVNNNKQSSITYGHRNNLPFTVITKHEGRTDQLLFLRGNKFVFFDEETVLNDTGVITAYSYCLMHNDYSIIEKHENTFHYDPHGRLERIEEQKMHDENEVYAEIDISYHNGVLSEVEFHFSFANMVHDPGSGRVGTLYYDDRQRMVYSAVFSAQHDWFFYDGDAVTPWAIVSMSNIPYSGGYIGDISFYYGRNTTVYVMR